MMPLPVNGREYFNPQLSFGAGTEWICLARLILFYAANIIKAKTLFFKVLHERK